MDITCLSSSLFRARTQFQKEQLQKESFHWVRQVGVRLALEIASPVLAVVALVESVVQGLGLGLIALGSLLPFGETWKERCTKYLYKSQKATKCSLVFTVANIISIITNLFDNASESALNATMKTIF